MATDLDPMLKEERLTEVKVQSSNPKAKLHPPARSHGHHRPAGGKQPDYDKIFNVSVLATYTISAGDEE